MHIPEREEGQGLVEYALLIALIAIIVLVILTILGTQVVLVMGRAAGGLQGDLLDTSAGDYAVIVSYDSNISGGGGVCSGTISNVNYVAVDSSGTIKTNQNIPVTVLVNSVPSGSITGSAGSSGLANYSGSTSVSAAGNCPLQITLK